MRLRVVQMRWEAERIVSLELVDAAGGMLPPWTAGAHVDVVLKSGLVRQYSLCGAPDDLRSYTVAVLHDPAGRGGSAEIHTGLRVGDEVEVRGPRNHFGLVPATRYVFVAGGIGITPILPMVEKLEREGAPWTLYYLGRTRPAMAFRERLATYGASVHVLPDDEAHGTNVDLIIERARGAHVYCCGPSGLIKVVEDRCGARGMAADCHVERFAVTPPASGEVSGNAPFTAVLASTGREIEVGADRTLLQCLLEGGVDLLFSCEEGVCGSCEVKVLDGIPLHRDSVLSPKEQAKCDRMMACVSRSKTPRIVLGL